MLRYKLRTLLIVLALGPPLLAGGYWVWEWSRPPFYFHEHPGGIGPARRLVEEPNINLADVMESNIGNSGPAPTFGPSTDNCP